MTRKLNPKCSGCDKHRYVGSPHFYVDSRTKLPRTECKQCLRTYADKWRKENPERFKKTAKLAAHKANLMIRYGLTVEGYNALVEQADELCGICRNPESRSRRLSLDHDHDTGDIRGFLCSNCNLSLGNKNVDWLERAVRYLKSEKRLKTSDQDPPIELLLFCPTCNEQHVDRGLFATKIHTTHACQHCGHVWRPAIVATVGVKFLPGFKDADPDLTKENLMKVVRNNG